MPTRNVMMSLFTLVVLLGMGWNAAVHAVEVPKERIQHQVVAHVKEKLTYLKARDEQADIQVEVVQVPGGPFKFPASDKLDDIHIETESALDRMYTNRVIVRVSMHDASGQKREIGVPVKIAIRKPVWVVKNCVNANQPISTRDLVLETREVSYGYQNVVGQERDLSKYIARVNLRPGEILDARKIVMPPDITRFSEIRITLTNNNGMTVTVPGVALQDGRLGETIRVRQDINQKRKVYTAKVIDRNRVLVEI